MSNNTIILICIGALLILIGGIIFAGAMTVLEWDFSKLSTNEYVTNSHIVKEDFSDINIKTNTADITIVPTKEKNVSVVCYEQKNVYHSVDVSDGTLNVKSVDQRKWYEYIGINFGTPKITLYLPEKDYGTLFLKSSTGDIVIPNNFIFENVNISLSTGDVKNEASVSGETKIKTSTGYIYLDNISTGSLDLSVTTGNIDAKNITCSNDINICISTGKTNISNINCKSIVSDGNTGDISIKDVIASEYFSITRSTGDVTFERCDAGEIFVKTDTGDVSASFLSGKTFFTKTDTGSINVPKSTNGGRCDITTDTGDIKIKIINQ